MMEAGFSKDIKENLVDPRFKCIVADLRLLIEQIDKNFKQASNLILEIAKRLDESRICPRDEICRRLKEILDDKIREGKITAKWIEECLPKEYKRKYIKKTNANSVRFQLNPKKSF